MVKSHVPSLPVVGAYGHGLGEWVRETRERLGMNQRTLADRAGLSRSYLCDIERGRGAQPSVATLERLASALGVARSELLRASGVIETPIGTAFEAAELRLLAMFRDLSPAGRESIERFARFTHAEEHRWMQPRLVEETLEIVGGGQPRGPMLFEDL